MKMPIGRVAGLAFASQLAFAGAALGEYPERNIQIFFPWGVTGAAYAVDQIVADKMGEELGVKLPVVSRPGAGGVRAFREGMAEDPDGYTILSGYVAPLVVAPVRGNADWTYEDFIPLYPVRSSVISVICRADEDRWTDFPSFIKYLQDNPGKTRYTTGSIDNLPHLVMAKVLQSQNAVSRPIPYQDMNDGVKELRTGVLDWMTGNANFVAANKEHVRVLAVLTDNPSARDLYDGAPLVTSFGLDIGLTGLSPTGWNWFVALSGTPDDVVDKLRAAQRKALDSDAYKEAMARTNSVIPDYDWTEYDKIVGDVAAQLESAKDAIEWEKQAVAAAGG